MSAPDRDVANSVGDAGPPLHVAGPIGRKPSGFWGSVRRNRRAFGHALEKAVKKLLYSALRALMHLGRPRLPPDWDAGPRRVLLLRFDKIGDMVLATGIIEAIVRAQPTVVVDVLASPGNAAVLDGNPHVKGVITIKKKEPASFLAALWRIRGKHYDAVLDPMFPRPSLTNMLLMWLSGARYRIGIAGRGNDYAFSHPVAPLTAAAHHIDQIAALLAAFGVDVGTVSSDVAARHAAGLPPIRGCAPAVGWGLWPSRLYLSPTELQQGEMRWRPSAGRAIRLLVNVSVGAVDRAWPEESFVAVLRHIKTQFPSVQALIVGGTSDAQRMDRIARASGAQAAHTPHYRQMMAIVAASDFVLTGDTSVTHIAAALDKPVLAMFRSSGGAIFGPYTRGYAIATSAPELDALEPEPVMQALEAMIRNATCQQAVPAGSLRA